MKNEIGCYVIMACYAIYRVIADTGIARQVLRGAVEPTILDVGVVVAQTDLTNSSLDNCAKPLSERAFPNVVQEQLRMALDKLIDAL
jgi:hypothetical protein